MVCVDYQDLRDPKVALDVPDHQDHPDLPVPLAADNYFGLPHKLWFNWNRMFTPIPSERWICPNLLFYETVQDQKIQRVQF